MARSFEVEVYRLFADAVREARIFTLAVTSRHARK